MKNFITKLKKAFTKHPAMTTWKLLVMPFALVSLVFTAIMVAIFNLDWKEGVRLFDEVF